MHFVLEAGHLDYQIEELEPQKQELSIATILLHNTDLKIGLQSLQHGRNQDVLNVGIDDTSELD